MRERFRVATRRALGRAVVAAGGEQDAASDLERLGLVGVNERGRYDFFRDRVMLPVIDHQKQVVGFGGRLLDPDAKDRKYVNSPESPLFHKKDRSTACTPRSTPFAARAPPSSWKGTSTCSPCARRHRGGGGPDGHGADRGTDRALKRSRTIVVVFDGDAAGQRAAQKAIPLFVDAGVADARIARLPGGVDPDDFVRQADRGPEAFRRLVAAADRC